MSEALGPVRYAPEAGYRYLGARTGQRQDVSPDTAAAVDREVRRLVDEAQARATTLLEQHVAALREIARVLQEREVIDGAQISRIAHAEQPAPISPSPDGQTNATGNGHRAVMRVPLRLKGTSSPVGVDSAAT